MTLSLTDLAFGYDRQRIGEGITLSIRTGEVLCLLGPNGCGKTTLFKTMLGLIRPHGGGIELDGKDIASFPRATFARKVGYVPQAGSGYFPFTVLDVVLMGRASRIGIFSEPSQADRTAALRSMDAIEVGHLATRRFTEISGGERQMVLIARALAQEPAMIVMDEPTASLDFGNQARVLAKIRVLAASGIAVLLSTHDPGQAFACADRVALMKSGKLLAMGAPADILTQAALRDLYGVDVAITYLAQAGHNVCAPVLHKPSEGSFP